MSCFYDIIKDLFIDCIFCNQYEEIEIERKDRRRIRKYRNKSTQTDNFKEPGSL
jgi:hypothetical protein